MASEDESSALDLSPPETQFLPKEDDEEVLWEVIEITGEKQKQKLYRVKWAGIDPKTNKPWAQSWVPKHDCTDDIVLAWKKKQAKKKKEQEKRKSSKSGSPASKRSRTSIFSHVSPDSSSTKSRQSITTANTVTVSDAKGKRKRSSLGLSTVDVAQHDPMNTFSTSRPKKRRRFDDDEEEEGEEEAEEEEEEEEGNRSLPENLPPKGKKVSGKAQTKPMDRKKQGAGEENEDDEENSSQDGWNEVDLELSAQRANRSSAAKGKQKSQDTPTEELSTANSPTKAEASRANNLSKKGKKRDQTSELLDDGDLEQPTADDKDSSGRRGKAMSSFAGNKDSRQSAPGSENKPIAKKKLPVATATANGVYPTKKSAAEASDDTGANKKSSTIRSSSTATTKRGVGRPRKQSTREVVLLSDVDEERESVRSTRKQNEHEDEDDPFISYESHPDDLAPFSSPPNRLIESDGEIAQDYGVSQKKKSRKRPSSRILDSDDAPMNIDMEGHMLGIDEEEVDAESESSMPSSFPREKSADTAYGIMYPPEEDDDPPLKSKKSALASTRAVGEYSYEREVIPETDSSRNNTESQETQADADRSKLRKTPSHSSIISRMRPWTPKSGSRVSLNSPPEANNLSEELSQPPSLGESFQKPVPKMKGLGPIPIISPSKFAPHLHRATAFDSTIETAEDLPPNTLEPIEQFQSPRKDISRHKVIKFVEVHRVEGQVSSSEIWESEVVQKGRSIAETAKEKKAKESGDVHPKKISLSDILKSNGVSDRRSEGESTTSPHPREEFDISQDHHDDNELEAPFDEVQSMEELYLDFSETALTEPEGGEVVDEEVRDVENLREEEEETTQDVQRDKEQAVNSRRMSSVESVELTSDWGDLEGSSYEPKDDTCPADESTEPPADPIKISPNESALHANSQNMPPSTLSQADQPSDSQNLQEGWSVSLESAMRMLSSRSGEVDALDDRLTREQTLNETLMRELEVTKRALSQAKNREDDFQCQLLKALQALDDEKAKQEAALESAAKSKALAEKDRDFFREQYLQASGFVTSVRDENVALLKRAEIAEDQAKSGVALVKATLLERIKTLESDARDWKRMANFVIEKDKRTNDDIRRRAAEEPQLRVHCLQLQQSLKGAAQNMHILKEQLEIRNADTTRLVGEIENYKKEIEALTVALEAAKSKSEEELPNATGTGNMDGLVYRCKWRVGQGLCQASFSNIQDLENHITSAGHIRL